MSLLDEYFGKRITHTNKYWSMSKCLPERKREIEKILGKDCIMEERYNRLEKRTLKLEQDSFKVRMKFPKLFR